MTLRRKLNRLTSLGRADWQLLAEASHGLAKARVLLALLPASKLIRRLTTDRADSECLVICEQDMSRLAWAIAAAANNLPWRTDCLVRCLAADLLLRRRNLTGQFHVGVAKLPDGALSAHAWMTCGSVSVAGGYGTDFVPLLHPDNPSSPSCIDASH